MNSEVPDLSFHRGIGEHLHEHFHNPGIIFSCSEDFQCTIPRLYIQCLIFRQENEYRNHFILIHRRQGVRNHGGGAVKSGAAPLINVNERQNLILGLHIFKALEGGSLNLSQFVIDGKD